MLSEYVRIKYHLSVRYSIPGEGAIETESIANYLIIQVGCAGAEEIENKSYLAKMEKSLRNVTALAAERCWNGELFYQRPQLKWLFILPTDQAWKVVVVLIR